MSPASVSPVLATPQGAAPVASMPSTGASPAAAFSPAGAAFPPIFTNVNLAPGLPAPNAGASASPNVLQPTESLTQTLRPAEASGGLSPGATAGIVIAILLMTAIGVGVAVYFVRQRLQKR
jgi:hypothetical protein